MISEQTLVSDTPAAPALKPVRPTHELSILGAGLGQVGLCRCGSWYADHESTSDDVSRAWFAHLAISPGTSAYSCDQCQRGVAQVRHGSVSLCAPCALDDLEATL